MAKSSLSLLLLLCVCGPVFVQCALDPALLASLKASIKEIAIVKVNGTGSLIKDIKVVGTEAGVANVVAADVITVAKKWGCTGVCGSRFRQVVLGAKTGFDMFTYTVANKIGELVEFVGAARNIKGKIEMAYMHSQAHGDTIQQYVEVKKKKCHHILFWKHCKTYYEKVARGFTAEELHLMADVLQYESYNYLLKEVNTKPPPMANGIANLKPNANPLATETLLERAIKAMIAKLPTVINDVKKDGYAVVKELVASGFSYFMERAEIQYTVGVTTKTFDSYVADTVSLMAIPTKERAGLTKVIEVLKYANTNDWIRFQIIFTAGATNAATECVIFGRHTPQNTFDFLTGKLGVSFKFAPDIFVVRQSTSSLGGLFGSSSDKIVLKPHTLSIADLNGVFSFFDVVMLYKAATIMNVIDDPAPLEKALDMRPSGIAPRVRLGDEAAGFLDKIVKALTGDNFNAIYAALEKLKFETSSTIQKEFMGPDNGFSKLEQDCFVWKIDGMIGSYLDEFLVDLTDILNLPKGHEEEFVKVLKVIKYSKSQEWMSYKMFFDINKGGNTKYAAVMVNHNTTENTYNWVIANMETTFKLAPNIFIVRNSKSSFGGLFTSVKDVIKEVPRGITDVDVDFIFNFLTVIQFKRFADLLGIKATNPPPITPPMQIGVQ